MTRRFARGRDDVDSGGQPPWRLLVTSLDWNRIRKHLQLSAREAQVAQCIVEGKKMTVIAEQLDLALGTVKTYSSRIHAKLRVTDQRELTLAVLDAARRTASAS